MGKLEGKVAVITGATSGMALATAKLFVQEGAYVYITGRRQEHLDAAVKAIGKNVKGIQGDAADMAHLDKLFETIKAEKGKIDVLFASAGVGEFQTMGSITEEHFDKIFDLNVKGTLFTVQKALPLISDGGSIIMNGSVANLKGIPNFGVYNASKAALRSFARTWTNELKDRKIRVNLMSPGPIDTAAMADVPDEMKKQFIAQVPMGRIGKSEEIATVVLFLASSDSSYVTGVDLCVDGGFAQV